MSSQNPSPDDIPPKWFEKWWDREQQRRAKREMIETGFVAIALGVGILAIGVGMAALEGVREIDVVEVGAWGVTAILVGVMFVFLSRYAAIREERK